MRANRCLSGIHLPESGDRSLGTDAKTLIRIERGTKSPSDIIVREFANKAVAPAMMSDFRKAFCDLRWDEPYHAAQAARSQTYQELYDKLESFKTSYACGLVNENRQELMLFFVALCQTDHYDLQVRSLYEIAHWHMVSNEVQLAIDIVEVAGTLARQTQGEIGYAHHLLRRAIYRRMLPNVGPIDTWRDLDHAEKYMRSKGFLKSTDVDHVRVANYLYRERLAVIIASELNKGSVGPLDSKHMLRASKYYNLLPDTHYCLDPVSLNRSNDIQFQMTLLMAKTISIEILDPWLEVIVPPTEMQDSSVTARISRCRSLFLLALKRKNQPLAGQYLADGISLCEQHDFPLAKDYLTFLKATFKL